MENLIPIPQGGAQKRPGTKYIAEVKTSSLATRLLPFEFSTSRSYPIEVGNQYMRFFTNGAPVLDGVGTEDISGLNNVIAHWLLNENEASVAVLDDDGNTHDGVASVDTATLAADDKVGSGSFDLDGQYDVEITDHSDFSFTNNSNDTPFSIACWGFVTQQNNVQVLLSKWRDAGLASEWRFSLTNERKLQLHLTDAGFDLSGDAVSQWKLNENAGNTSVVDTIGLQNGVSTVITSTLAATGQIDGAFDFDGQYAVEINDNAAYSFGNGTTDSVFSIAAWVFITGFAPQDILTKWDASTGSQVREWRFFLASNRTVFLDLYDESANAFMRRNTTIGLSVGWNFIVATYDATEANTGIKLYVNGSLASSTGFMSGTYTAMENGVTKVVIGAFTGSGGSLINFFSDKIDNVVLFDKELTQADVSGMYNDGNGTEDLTGTGAAISSVADDAISAGWHFLCSTYSAPADESTAADGIILYVDGVAVALTATNNANYAAMQNGAEEIRIGSQRNSGDSANEKFWADKVDEVSVFGDVLTPTEIASLYSTIPYEIETPFLTTDLFNLKFEQSADVLYLTHPDYETQKVSRMGNAFWTITAIDFQDGPFRAQNTDVADFIAASATTGSITLTATGHSPFALGSTAGHEPSGPGVTDKSQTGALFKLVHPIDTLEFKDTLEDDYAANQTEGVSWMACGTLYKGAEWSWTTGGTWLGTVEVQRNYTIGASDSDSGWESVLQFSGLTTARNVTTSGTEDDGDADYRVIFTDDTSGIVISYFSTDQTEVIGIVEITSVTSSTEAIGTVIKTLASTDATYKWSEGAWSNYRGWPQTVTFFEDRLTFGGNTAQPDTIWASVTGDYQNMTAGPDDDEALIFTLSSRQVNVIEWIIGKDKLLIGTSGAEWTIAGGTDEPLTPSNAIAKQHSTYGSANLQAGIANESVLFFQRGAKKMRELAYNWELDSYVAPDMTILANLVTGSGIVETAFQKTPDSILWCIRADGELPVFAYERKENITAWSRMVTTDGTSDSDFESIARIHGSPEDEIWVIVKRTIDSNSVRYIEQFQPRDFGADADDAYYVDCGLTYDSTPLSTMTGGTHLVGETVSVLADGVVFDDAVVNGSGEIILKLGGTTTTASTVHWGLPYEVKLRTMPLSWVAEGATIQGRQKKIGEVIANWYVSGDFSVGRDASTLGTMSISGQTTDQDRITFPPGWDRNGYVYVYQKSPEPLTLLGLAIEFDVQ